MRATVLALFLIAAWTASPAAAQSRQLGVPFDNGRGIRECSDLRGFVDVSDPGGRALHRGPGDEYPVLGRLSGGTLRGGVRRVPVEVTMTYDGWLRVRGPAVEAVLAGLPEAELERAGDNVWIVGWDVTAAVDASGGFSFPRGSSRVVLWSTDGRPLTDHARLADIVACEGYWIFGRWEVRALDRLRAMSDLRKLEDPPRMEVWTPQRSPWPTREDRRRAMDDWLVETYGEEELSRAVSLTRVGDDFAIRYYVSFWHGNHGPYYSAEVERPGRTCSGEDWRRDENSRVWDAEPDRRRAARDLRARLTRYFEACDSTAEEIAAALEGFDPAFAVAAAWSDEDSAHVMAVARSIESYGEEPVEEPPE